MDALPGFEVVDANLREALRGFCYGPGGELERNGIAIRDSGEDFAMFNAAVISSPVADLADLIARLRAARDYYRGRGVAWSVWVCEQWLGDDLAAVAANAFSRSGLRYVLDMPALAAMRVAPPSRDLPPLEFRPVNDGASRAIFAQLMAACFGIPSETARAMYERERLWECGFTGWLGYATGIIVGCAATVVAAGVAGLYSVATLPQFERRGCGEALCRHALAQTGVEPTVLQSSAEGYGLYARMGYEPVARYVVWASG